MSTLLSTKQGWAENMNSRMTRLIVSLLFLGFGSVFAQENQRQPANAEAKLEAFLKRYPASDADGDGKLSLAEFREFRQKQLSGQEMKDRLREALKRFPQADANKDGMLTPDEFRDFQERRRNLLNQRESETRVTKIAPTDADVSYGDHEKQRFDIWAVPDATEPTPLVIYIHGGGFRGGDKSGVQPEQIKQFLDAGVAFASMNYRLSDVGPYPIMMQDAARGLQTIRHRASEWNLDPERIACFGGSAGAGISLWLAFHDDLADPESDDPVARQSTRILAAGTNGGQSTYDMYTYREWFGIPNLPMHTALPAFYGIESEADLGKPEIRALMRDASPISHLSADDRVSVYMKYGRSKVEINEETPQSVWVHHVKLGWKLKEAMEKFGLECQVTASDFATKPPYGSMEVFLIDKLRRN